MFRFVTSLIPAITMVSVAAFAVCGAAGFAKAQAPKRGETVADRPRPELDPLGVRLGGFLFYPQLAVAGQYDSNVFQDETGEIADYITVVSLGMQLRSNWNNHQLNFFASSEMGFYTDYDTENYVDYTLGADGRADFYRVSSLTAAILYSRHHEDRGSPDAVNGAVEPTVFDILAPEIEYSHKFGRFSLRIGGGLQRYDFENGEMLDGTPIINDDRDRDEQEGFLRMGFEIVPGYEAFIQGTYNNRVYVETVADRNSSGYELVAGTAIDLTGVTFGEVFVGYRLQEYENATFETNEGVQYGGAITWNPSGLTTVQGGVSRTVEETTRVDSSGFIATKTGLSVDHELLRSLLLGINASYTTMEYQGVIPRTDNYVKAGAYGKYMLNRHLYISARYNYTSRESTEPGEDFLNNVFMFNIKVQY